MAIIIRAFNFWTHVSAESTSENFKIYLSAGSYPNEKKLLKDYKKYKDRFGFDTFPYIKSQKGKRQLVIEVLVDKHPLTIKVDKINANVCVVNLSDALEKLKTVLTDKKDIQKLASLICFPKFNIANSKQPKFKGRQISYFMVEPGAKADRIKIPTLQDGFDYGLDEAKFYEAVCNLDGNEFQVLKNNCADYVVSALNESGIDQLQTPELLKILSKTHINLGIFRIRNPNIRLISKSTVDYAKAIREAILIKTIIDPDKKLSTLVKFRSVLLMEIDRLEEEIDNIKKNSAFYIFRKKSAEQKLKKQKILEDAFSKLVLEGKNDDDCKKILQELLQDKRLGISRKYKTRSHLLLLQQEISRSPLVDASQQQARLEQYEKQMALREKRLKWIALGAIIFTPVSLLITLPIWFIAKQLEPIKELAVTKEKYNKVKGERKAFKNLSKKVSLNNQNQTKPRKIILFQDEKNVVYLVDKAQLTRFNLFANNKSSYLMKNKDKVIAQSANSIIKSKKSRF